AVIQLQQTTFILFDTGYIPPGAPRGFRLLTEGQAVQPSNSDSFLLVVGVTRTTRLLWAGWPVTKVFPFHNSALSVLLNGAMLHSAKMPPTRYEVLSDSSSLHHPCVSVCHSTTILFMRRTHVTSTLRL
ncbi:hypothetical protein KUCAC02_008288, partial [Chaenocephalus aceratus]